jgi:Amidohydrolase
MGTIFRGPLTPEQNLADNDLEGIDLQIIYPTGGLSFAFVRERDLAIALARTYNDWLYGWCSIDGKRLKGVAAVALHADIQESIREMERAVGQLGAVGVMVNTYQRDRNVAHRDFWPFLRGVRPQRRVGFVPRRGHRHHGAGYTLRYLPCGPHVVARAGAAHRLHGGHLQLDDDTLAIDDRIVANRSPGRHPRTGRLVEFLLTHQGRRISLHTLRDELAYVAKVAGSGVITPHQLRHTYATALVNAGPCPGLEGLASEIGCCVAHRPRRERNDSLDDRIPRYEGPGVATTARSVRDPSRTLIRCKICRQEADTRRGESSHARTIGQPKDVIGPVRGGRGEFSAGRVRSRERPRSANGHQPGGCRADKCQAGGIQSDRPVWRGPYRHGLSRGQACRGTAQNGRHVAGRDHR